MGEEQQFADAVVLTFPEQLPSKRIGQYSVVSQAMDFLSVIVRHRSLKTKLKDQGIEFGGRVLLLGSVGTDFESFIHYLAQEMPINTVRLRIKEVIGNDTAGQALRTAFEFAKRNSPSILWIDRFDMIAPLHSPHAVVLREELLETTWDNDEVMVVASTSQPGSLDPWLLSAFDRTYVTTGTSLDDRTRILEEILSGREDIDPTIVAELTEGWSYADVKHLAASLFMLDESKEGQTTKERIEEIIDRSGVFPIGRADALETLAYRLEAGDSPEFSRVEENYPDDFLDQLYLMAVGDDFQRTQSIIETLNQGSPLSSKDIDFLSRYPFLMNGTSDDRLTRLLRAKKSSDRLRRIMGR